MWWDGLKFFTFDDTKLQRLNGSTPHFTDKFKNKKWIITNLIGITIALYILISYAKMMGDEKSQAIGYVNKTVYSYPSN